MCRGRVVEVETYEWKKWASRRMVEKLGGWAGEGGWRTEEDVEVLVEGMKVKRRVDEVERWKRKKMRQRRRRRTRREWRLKREKKCNGKDGKGRG